MSKSKISAIFLAAGESKRMGQPKLLLPFADSTILEQALDRLLKANVDEVIVVLGAEAEQTMEKIAHRPVKVAINPDYRQGMGTSIAKGVSLVNEGARPIMLVLADQPLIDSEIIDHLVTAFFNHDRGIVVPVYQGRRGHPVIFSAIYKRELLKLKGDVGGRQIITEHPADILEVPIDAPSVTVDIDTIEDYRSLTD